MRRRNILCHNVDITNNAYSFFTNYLFLLLVIANLIKDTEIWLKSNTCAKYSGIESFFYFIIGSLACLSIFCICKFFVVIIEKISDLDISSLVFYITVNVLVLHQISEYCIWLL